jgi:two-component system LytT family response regulator
MSTPQLHARHQQIRAVVIDDEPLARTGLIRLLQEEPDITIVGEGRNGQEALELIRSFRPDLIFLDIQMPEMDGFEVVDSLEHENRPVIIFVTAYDEYAIRAFEIHALDYLLKPYSAERFKRAVEHARQQLDTRNGDVQLGEMLAYVQKGQRMLEHLVEGLPGIADQRYLERLVIKSTGRIQFLRVEDVDWIEADADYVRLHAHGKQHLVRAKIGELEQRLDPRLFLRIHRSTIVQLDRVKELRPLFHGDFLVVLHDNTELTLSRSYRGRLSQFLDRPI